MGAPIVAHGDRPPIFEFGKHVLDFVSVLVERLVVQDAAGTICPRRNAGNDTERLQRGSESIGIIPAISQQCVCSGYVAHEHLRPRIMADLPCSDMKLDRLAMFVTDGVEFGVQPTCGPADLSCTP